MAKSGQVNRTLTSVAACKRTGDCPSAAGLDPCSHVLAKGTAMGASFGFVFGIGGSALVACHGLDEWDAGGQTARSRLADGPQGVAPVE